MSNVRLWRKGGWTLIADRREVFPDDPGQGTPLMVEAPNGATATAFCAMDVGVLDDGGKDAIEMPSQILAWLGDVMADAETWVFSETEK